MLTFILLMSAVGIIMYWAGGEVVEVLTGDLDTFLGKLLGYFAIIVILSAIIG